MNVEEIATAITQLSDEEAWQLSNWFMDYMNQKWAEKIDGDANTSRLEDLVKAAKAESLRDENNSL
jgi:hypothetical protein